MLQLIIGLSILLGEFLLWLLHRELKRIYDKNPNRLKMPSDYDEAGDMALFVALIMAIIAVLMIGYGIFDLVSTNS